MKNGSPSRKPQINPWKSLRFDLVYPRPPKDIEQNPSEPFLYSYLLKNHVGLNVTGQYNSLAYVVQALRKFGNDTHIPDWPIVSSICFIIKLDFHLSGNNPTSSDQ